MKPIAFCKILIDPIQKALAGYDRISLLSRTIYALVAWNRLCMGCLSMLCAFQSSWSISKSGGRSGTFAEWSVAFCQRTKGWRVTKASFEYSFEWASVSFVTFQDIAINRVRPPYDLDKL